MLSKDADASMVGAGSLKDSKSDADAGADADGPAGGIWEAGSLGGSVAAKGSPTHVERPLPHDWQVV